MKITPIFQQGSAIREGHSAFDDRIDGGTNALPYGKFATGTELWESPDTIYGQRVKGDKWLYVTEVDGKPLMGWIAITHLTKAYCSVVDSPPPPPTGVTVKFVDIFFDDGTSVRCYPQS